MKKIKEAIMRAVVYLLLGFVMTWLVAWGLAYVPHWVEPGWYKIASYSTASERSANAQSYFVFDHRWIGAWERLYTDDKHAALMFKRNSWTEVPGVAPFWWVWEIHHPYSSLTLDWHELKRRYKSLTLLQSTDPDFHVMYYSIVKYGWPALSHQGQGSYDLINYRANGTLEHEVDGVFAKGFGPPRNLSENLFFPYQPIWTGLVFNTLFYAIALFALSSLWRTYRSMRRFRKGRCPICAYDLQYNNTLGCPECGWRKKEHT